jgi:pyruvate-formate lyase-activating enzyme
MKTIARCSLRSTAPILLALFAGSIFIRCANAQNPELQQHVSDIQQSMAKNKQSLAQYTWNEQVTISLKGEEKKQ